VMINKNSIERGMFNISVFKSFVDTEENNPMAGERVMFANPFTLRSKGVDIKPKYGYWSKINEDGFPKENVMIDEEDVYIGKVNVKTEVVKKENDSDIFNESVQVEHYSDKSKMGDKSLSGVVDKVYVYTTEENTRKLKIRFRKMRKPELGDKMASRHGQKGVVGMIVPQESMPFTKDGLVPDIVINPHAFPSRMTIGHLLECVLSKLCCMSGTRADATVFDALDVESYCDILENKYGMHRYGDEVLYNGFSGEQMTTDIFIGPTYYYRLKHMVKDKVNYRGTGPLSTTTRQPTKGRSKGGGLRIGEMETNVLLSYGFGSFLKESMMERSDHYEMMVDGEEGTVAIANRKKGVYKKAPEESSYDVRTLHLPYSMKQLIQEVEAFGISARLVTDAPDEDDEEDDAYALAEAALMVEELEANNE
jgi:DNA-directed RNA polymerase II subunit RPB2